MQTQIENIPEYHTVFANIMQKALETIMNKDINEAKKLLKATIIMVYTLRRADESEFPDANPSDIQKEIDGFNLDKKSVDELILLMSFHQARIGITPRQTTQIQAQRWRTFRRGA